MEKLINYTVVKSCDPLTKILIFSLSFNQSQHSSEISSVELLNKWWKNEGKVGISQCTV